MRVNEYDDDADVDAVVGRMNPNYRFELCAGTLGCLVWPVLLGYIMADDNWGKWGIHCGLAIMAVVMYFVVHYNGTVFKYLARGSWILALASIIPVIPVHVGGWLIQESQAVFGVASHVDEGPRLDFLIALIVTMAYSLVYIAGSVVVGWMVYKCTDGRGTGQSEKADA